MTYTITVVNKGPHVGSQFSLWDVVPDKTNLDSKSFSVPPTKISAANDSLFWSFDSLAPEDSLRVKYTVHLSDSVSGVPVELVSTSGVRAQNDADQSNNSRTTTVFAIGKKSPAPVFHKDTKPTPPAEPPNSRNGHAPNNKEQNEQSGQENRRSSRDRRAIPKLNPQGWNNDSN
ncbi:DUF11 domain-containing protein [candidate division KSB1 bacterium]|nr:DUF11 domain-containing protein [candidate division KSB1 bacterium]NIS23596.1 DUF11 domain-containing protein [candidate division KSB1 bacterium]NIT70522.1 DUF11 domain-containing protein [candidate division KSB1 bacterium]NIU24230.1 DUF11 domain-containing protein [candidate division KSB1 bacterium]NIU93782.1 DUF11 domain-containing protein [candidate division KSB1 bacterium]